MMESGKDQVSDGAVEEVAEGETETTHVGSEEVEIQITAIHEKADRYTERLVIFLKSLNKNVQSYGLVSELLDEGKTLFKDLSNNFEERLIVLHKEQMERFEEEIRELRLIDASNEETNVVFWNARQLLQNAHMIDT